VENSLICWTFIYWDVQQKSTFNYQKSTEKNAALLIFLETQVLTRE
jgi:hypothetical protein